MQSLLNRRTQNRATEALPQVRDQAVDDWHPEAIREGVAEAARQDAKWLAHADVAAWLRSWGTDDQELPPPPARRRV